MVGLGRSIAVELAGSGVRVNAVSPGLCNTGMWRELLGAAGEAAADEVVAHWNHNIPIKR